MIRPRLARKFASFAKKGIERRHADGANPDGRGGLTPRHFNALPNYDIGFTTPAGELLRNASRG